MAIIRKVTSGVVIQDYDTDLGVWVKQVFSPKYPGTQSFTDDEGRPMSGDVFSTIENLPFEMVNPLLKLKGQDVIRYAKALWDKGAKESDLHPKRGIARRLRKVFEIDKARPELDLITKCMDDPSLMTELAKIEDEYIHRFELGK